MEDNTFHNQLYGKTDLNTPAWQFFKNKNIQGSKKTWYKLCTCMKRGTGEKRKDKTQL